MWHRRARSLSALGLALGLAACAPGPRPAPGPAPTTTAPAAVVAESTARYRVVASHLTVRVYRDGPLARLGHNHVVSSNALGGDIDLATPRAATRFALELPLESLAVDLPEDRALAGPDFAAPVPEADRAATRRNMLGEKLLDAARSPSVRVESLGLAGGPADWRATVRITLAGRSHDVEIPIRVETQGQALGVEGSVTLDHAALGLTPFAVALGALRVRPDLEFAFSLRARPADP